MNRIQMRATLVERSALRYTPAGVPVIEAQLHHRSQVVESGLQRQLDFDFDAVAVGEVARELAGQTLGGALQLNGFLAPRSLRSKRLLVHVQSFSGVPDEGAVGG